MTKLYWKPTENPAIEHPGKNADFGGSIGMDVVHFIEPNLQEIIFTPIRVGLINQKQFWGHLKNDIYWAGPPTETVYADP